MRQAWLFCEHLQRSSGVCRTPIQVRQAREAQEHINLVVRIGGGRIPDERSDLREVLLQPCPAREFVGTGDDELSIREREPSDGLLRVGMELPDLRQGISVSSLDSVEKSLRLLAEMFERRVVRQRTCWHSDLLARA